MSSLKQPMDLTHPKHDWVKHYGRLRIGWISRLKWWVYGYRKRNWFLYFRFYKKYNYQTGNPVRYFQFTILGFQLCYLYKGELLTNGKML
jgi:hypothetical protein